MGDKSSPSNAWHEWEKFTGTFSQHWLLPSPLCYSLNEKTGQLFFRSGKSQKSTLVVFLLVFLRQLFSDNFLNPLDAYIVECSWACARPYSHSDVSPSVLQLHLSLAANIQRRSLFLSCLHLYQQHDFFSGVCVLALMVPLIGRELARSRTRGVSLLSESSGCTLRPLRDSSSRAISMKASSTCWLS